MVLPFGSHNHIGVRAPYTCPQAPSHPLAIRTHQPRPANKIVLTDSSQQRQACFFGHVSMFFHVSNYIFTFIWAEGPCFLPTQTTTHAPHHFNNYSSHISLLILHFTKILTQFFVVGHTYELAAKKVEGLNSISADHSCWHSEH